MPKVGLEIRCKLQVLCTQAIHRDKKTLLRRISIYSHSVQVEIKMSGNKKRSIGIILV